MMIRLLSIFTALFLLTSCLEEEHQIDYEVMGGESAGYAMEDMQVMSSAAPIMGQRAKRASGMVLDRSRFEGRRIAENHRMSVEVEKEALKARYQRDLQKCIELQCDLVNSSINAKQNASLNARIKPDHLGAYLDFIADGQGELKSHRVSATDKTMQYVDTQSKLKNQTALRDRLLKLLDSYKAKKIKDILEIERELTRVQSQIDSLTGQMRSLEKVTSKATVNVSYTIPPRASEIVYHDIGNSFRYAWNGFLRSISEVVAFVLKILPWIPIWFIGGWLAVKIIRFAFKKTGGWTKHVLFWKKNAKK